MRHAAWGSSVTDGLPQPSDRDFDLLRASKSRSWPRIAVKAGYCLVVLLAVLLLATYLFKLRDGQQLSADVTRERVLSLQHRWSENFVVRWDQYRRWMVAHGTQTESVLFDDLSALVINSLVRSNSAQLPEQELGGVSRLFVALHLGVVRLLFVVIAAIRISLAVGLLACLRGLVMFRPYRREDALGQMGNGRVFYSGVRAGLDSVTAEGAPDVQVRGFACPQMSTPSEARNSSLWRVLHRYGADNETNLVLTQILLKNGKTAAYVAAAGEEELLARAFSGSPLFENACEILGAALEQHSEYTAQRFESRGVEDTLAVPSQGISSEEYGRSLKHAFDSVLTDSMKRVLAELPATEVASMILALESGKVLAHSFEGGKWVRRSNFPHLSARAVLHSIVEYPKDYDLCSRTRIRRGLIYAARKSAFSPVRMPIDMSDDSWALRQWAEVLLACPHEIVSVADEVELVGIVREGHALWRQEFFHSSQGEFETLRAKAVATATNLLFLPVPDLVVSMRRCVPAQAIARMHVLLGRVAAAQAKQRAVENESDSGPTLQLSFERIEPPPSAEELKKLCEMHTLELQVVRDWLALRTILSTYGWVASRVGDYSVPHISIIFAVFRSSIRLEGANSLGLVGKSGMVPLRGSKLIDEWGSSWSDGFTRVDRSTMAENIEDYQKLMQGIEDIKVLEDDPLFSPSKLQA